MGIFNFFRNRQSQNDNSTNGNPSSSNSSNISNNSSEIINQNIDQNKISEEVFTLKETDGKNDINQKFNEFTEDEFKKIGIDLVFEKLNSNYYETGYKDAMNVPDRSIMEIGLNKIKATFKIIIQEEKNNLEKKIMIINGVIEKNISMGLLDIAEANKKVKMIIEKEIAKLDEFLKKINEENGPCEIPISTYKNGFIRGMQVIDEAKIDIKG